MNILYKISSKYRILQDYMGKLIINNPEIFLKSSDFKNIDKLMLMSLQWEIEQIENLEEEKKKERK